MAGKERQMMLN